MIVLRYIRLAALLTLALSFDTIAWAGNGVGRWSSLAPWPLIPIHAVLLSNGDVLTYGTKGDGTQTGRFTYDVWNPRQGLAAGAHNTLPNTTVTDLFCNAQILLPNSGDIVMLGGDQWDGTSTTNYGNRDSVVFSLKARERLRQGASMRRVRWYATATTLPSGETYIQGGDSGFDRPEIRGSAGDFRLLSKANTSSLYYFYPRNWVDPSGRIFGYSDRAMYYVDTGGQGMVKTAGVMPDAGPSGVTSSEVMFAPGRILRVGGGSNYSSGGAVGKSAATVIDLNSGKPVLKAVQPMPTGLHWANATVVADGRVVVTGGGLYNNKLVGASYRALIWDPAKPDAWIKGAQTTQTKAHARLYHSIGLLLPDATILVGGGGASGTTVKGPSINTNAEIYYPPYLFTADSEFAPRPRIVLAPRSISVGQHFGVTVDSGTVIARVTLVKTGSVTHSFNMDQRFQELRFTRSGNMLTVTAPVSRLQATPGRYLLFLLDAAGVPSVAAILALS